jgi:hypothetical protein
MTPAALYTPELCLSFRVSISALALPDEATTVLILALIFLQPTNHVFQFLLVHSPCEPGHRVHCLLLYLLPHLYVFG